MSVGAAAFLLSGVSQLLAGSTTNCLTADEVIRRAVSRAEKAEARAGQTGYTYTKLTLTEQFDAAGHIKERKEKVYQVNFQGGATYLKLLSVNGKAPAQADSRQQTENEMNVRQILGKSKSAKGDNRENFLTPELVARFDFTLEGEKVINGRRSYAVTFEPKNPAPPVHRIVDRLLNRLSGTIWIDADEFEIAQAEVYLGSEVDLLGGMAGCLRKLAYTMTRTRLGDGLWFNTLSTGDFEGRKLLDSMRIKTKSQSTNFRPLRMAS